MDGFSRKQKVHLDFKSLNFISVKLTAAVVIDELIVSLKNRVNNLTHLQAEESTIYP